MTKNEIKAALDLAGITYAKKANLETLQALYDAMPKGEEVHPELAAAISTIPEQPAADAPQAQEEPAPAPTEGAGLKIEKDRPEQNGIKRPSIGGKCRAIWDALDAYRAETGELPTSKTVKELAADEGWNPNNASIEYYQWRKYNGISKQS
jgi:hypothetical protein